MLSKEQRNIAFGLLFAGSGASAKEAIDLYVNSRGAELPLSFWVDSVLAVLLLISVFYIVARGN